MYSAIRIKAIDLLYLCACLLVVCRLCDGQFVGDASYPDGSCVAPGITLSKTWIVRNTGSVAWAPTVIKVDIH